MISRSDRLSWSQTVAEALSANDSGYLDCSHVVIDLITYEIVELKPMLKVREETAGKRRSLWQLDSELHLPEAS
jgi:hypothetical protein